MSGRKYTRTDRIAPIWMIAVNAVTAGSLTGSPRALGDGQMARAGDRQELGQALDHPEDDRLNQVHCGGLSWIVSGCGCAGDAACGDSPRQAGPDPGGTAAPHHRSLVMAAVALADAYTEAADAG